MALIGNSILKASVRYTLWGLGIYVGLRIVGPLLISAAKPVTRKVAKGYHSVVGSVKSKTHPTAAEDVEEEIEIAEQTEPNRAKEDAPQRAGKPVATKGEHPNTKWSKAELYAKAKELKIADCSSMNKEQLLEALTTTTSHPTT